MAGQGRSSSGREKVGGSNLYGSNWRGPLVTETEKNFYGSSGFRARSMSPVAERWWPMPAATGFIDAGSALAACRVAMNANIPLLDRRVRDRGFKEVAPGRSYPRRKPRWAFSNERWM
ncbi:hypothetical protein [Georgenia ruanii]|uniref:hypothetical protein n=1 Tax=Georgenia ruanii TaxID=348442 RepID=UPI00126418A0|nr:hypothetical protein [Georgenia ruanii]